MSKSRVRHTDLEVGKPLPWDVFDDKGTLLLSKGFVIANENQIDRLVAVGVSADSAALRESRLRQAALEDDEDDYSPLREWLDLRKKMELLIDGLGAEISAGTFVDHVTEIAHKVDELCTAKPELAQAIISLHQDGRYSSRHMLDSAVIVRLAGRMLKLPLARESSTVCAALTMNLGSTGFQDAIKAQAGPLQEDQLTRLHMHPKEAYDRLAAIGITDMVWLRAVLEHHEQVDGEGYPQHLSGKQISAEGQLVRLADIYAARITFREYRSAVPLTFALRDILQDKGKTTDATISAQFIRAVGIFPPGLKLRLKNGESGVVVRAGSSPNHPIVYCLLNAKGEPMNPGILRDTVNPEFGVDKTIDPVTFKAYVDVDAIWG